MNNSSAKRVLISVGEASGDMHAANLVKSVKKLNLNVEFFGMGGNLMQKAGVDTIVDAKSLSLIGALEIITKFFKILRAFFTMKKALYKDKPDLLILVDYPGFNLRLAKAAKKAGVKVLYYISPKIWAWHQSRIKIIKKCVDMMAVIFPFEVDFYGKWQVPVKFVGNPLLKSIDSKLPIEEAYKLFDINKEEEVVGLFPGSRSSEIEKLLPVMLEAIKIIKKQNPRVRFLLPQASSISDSKLQKHLELSEIPVQVVKGQNIDVMQVCDAIITASGTATLEIALIGTPLVIIYKLSPLEYQLAKRFIKIPYVGLCNILAGKEVAKELLQHDATPEKIAVEISKILGDKLYRNVMKDALSNIKKSLKNNSQEDLAQVVLEMLD